MVEREEELGGEERPLDSVWTCCLCFKGIIITPNTIQKDKALSSCGISFTVPFVHCVYTLHLYLEVKPTGLIPLIPELYVPYSVNMVVLVCSHRQTPVQSSPAETWGG